MEIATLTSKSQITMPKAVRESLGLAAGDRVQFVPARNGYRIVAVHDDLSALRGMFKGRRRTRPNRRHPLGHRTRPNRRYFL